MPFLKPVPSQKKAGSLPSPPVCMTLPKNVPSMFGNALLRPHQIAELPESQRTVITLRDVTGCDARDVSETLGISPGNQRVLLHRARVRVRAQLERHLDG